MNNLMKGILKGCGIALGIIILVGLIILVIYIDIKDNKQNFKKIYDDCDYFITVGWGDGSTMDSCYSSYAYLRMKEDNRNGKYCFVSENHKTIYAGKVCHWQNNSLLQRSVK